MRAAFCTGPGALVVREVASPLPRPGEVRLRVHACGICGSDLHYFHGESRPPRGCPGHELSGTLLDPCGPLAPGTPVVAEPLLACGSCPQCRAAEPNLCPRLRLLGLSSHAGALAEEVVVPAAGVHPLPPDLDLDRAVLAEPLAVAVHAAKLAGIAPGSVGLVLGGGAIGLLTAYAARRLGARVQLSARHPHQAAMARTLGATAIAADPEAVRAAYAARAPDVVLETVGGTAATLGLALEVVRPAGRVVMLGVFTRPVPLDAARLLTKEIHLVGAMTYRRSPEPDFAVALRWLAEDADLLGAVVTHRVSLADVGRGFALAADKTRGSIKVAVHPHLAPADRS